MPRTRPSIRVPLTRALLATALTGIALQFAFSAGSGDPAALSPAQTGAQGAKTAPALGRLSPIQVSDWFIPPIPAELAFDKPGTDVGSAATEFTEAGADTGAIIPEDLNVAALRAPESNGQSFVSEGAQGASSAAEADPSPPAAPVEPTSAPQAAAPTAPQPTTAPAPPPPTTAPSPPPPTAPPPPPPPPPTSTPRPAPTSTPPPPPPAPVGLTSMEQQLFDGQNAERARAGVAPLRLDSGLQSIARRRAQDMATRGYFSHTSPTGETAFSLMAAAGIQASYAAENIAFNTYDNSQSAAMALNGFMSSPGHRANILNGVYTRVGVAVAIAANGAKYYAVVFAGP